MAALDPSFICPLSAQPAYDAVVCPQGHLFDEQFILRWLQQSATCPIDRTCLTPNMLVPVLSIRSVVGDRPNPIVFPETTSSQTAEDIERDRLFALGLIEQPVPHLDMAMHLADIRQAIVAISGGLRFAHPEPALARFSTDAVIDDDMPELVHDLPELRVVSDNAIVYDGRGLTLQLFNNGVYEPAPPSRRVIYLTREHLINPRSRIYNALLLNVRQSNLDFAVHHGILNRLCELRRFLFRHSSPEIVFVLRHARHHGYFVYDMFRLRPGLYVITTFTERVSGSHTLHPFI